MRNYGSIMEIQKDIHLGILSCKDLVSFHLERIRSFQHLNAFLETFDEEALQRAAEIDLKIKEGRAGRLFGAVVSLKDVLCYKGHRVGASSRILEGFTSLFTATAIQRLLDEDAIIIGRVNCDEFAMGSSNENSAFGAVGNFIDPDYVPGGSSGGSAVSVQANLCQISIGSDTGGSVRQPASFTGLVGLKPTYGRISRYGLLAYASSFDQICPIGKSVEDVALVTSIMAGSDPYDSTTIQTATRNYEELDAPVEQRRIAYFSNAIHHPGLDPEIRASFLLWMDRLKSMGHHIEEMEFPFLEYLVPAYYVLTTAEASSNLARYDGVHYGYRHPEAKSMEEVYEMSRSAGFGPEVKRRIMLGTFVLSSGYYDAYYAKAQKLRRSIQTFTQDVLKTFDFIAMPTTPTAAFKKGDKTQDHIAMYLADIFTVQANLAGIPAISLPMMRVHNNWPVGMQWMADVGKEYELLSFSRYCMNQTATFQTHQ